MLFLFVIALFVLGSALFFLLPALVAREVHHEHSAPRAVTCPETQRQVAVTIDARHLAATSLSGTPDFRLSDCTQWPERAKCAQNCLPEALRSDAYTQGEVEPSRSVRQFYHLPVLLAAFTAWYVGMIWHSPYLFRACWMAAVGLTPTQLKQLVNWFSPHLLTFAACLLFAYGVGWIQTWLSRKGFWPGIMASTLLWATLVVATLPSTLSLPRDLLVIEAGYTLIAAILVGAIIGGLNGKLVLPERGRLEA
ncbi:MAG TPA: DUF1761 domain-containing protein [Candidatus Sulfotelmatobacter sp.]|nr:DUF1761 domain-containing protein [Candidatus Sulfotelmatobacter sp.]